MVQVGSERTWLGMSESTSGSSATTGHRVGSGQIIGIGRAHDADQLSDRTD